MRSYRSRSAERIDGWPSGVTLSILGLLVASMAWTMTGPWTPGAASGSGNPLLRTSPEIVLKQGEVVLLAWEIDDAPTLWQETGGNDLPHLRAWRSRIAEEVHGTGPLELIRQSRERYPWLESEHPAVREINRRVERGELGRHRPMSFLESALLDYHAARYPLFERPSEFGAFVLRRDTEEGPRVRLYCLTDGEGLPPKIGADAMLERVAADRQAGWEVHTFVHNHTFDLESEKGGLAVAAPSASDLQLFGGLSKKIGLEEAWIVDGFNSIVLEAEDFEPVAGSE